MTFEPGYKSCIDTTFTQDHGSYYECYGSHSCINSVLNTRDIILSVNNNPETKHMTSIEVVTYIAEECPEYVTILAKTSHSTGVVVFSS